MTRCAFSEGKRVYYTTITTSKGGHQRDNLRMKVARSPSTSEGAIRFLRRTRNLILKDSRCGLFRRWRWRSETNPFDPPDYPADATYVVPPPAVRVFNLQISSGLQIGTLSSDLPSAPVPVNPTAFATSLSLSSFAPQSVDVGDGKARYGERNDPFSG